MTRTVTQLFPTAFRHHQSGNILAAEALYRQVLTQDPAHLDALHLLGMIGTDIALLCRAIRLDAQVPEFHANLGMALRAAGRHEAAVASYRRALALKPDLPQAHNNLGTVFRDQGALEEAARCFETAFRLKPDYLEALYNLATIRGQQGRHDEAERGFRDVLRLVPAFAEAHNNLGIQYQDQSRFAAAVACFQNALACRPDFPQALNNLGNALKNRGQVDESVTCYRRAVRLKPEDAEAHANLMFAALYQPGVGLAEIHEEARRWNAAHAPAVAAAPVPRGGDKPRLGFVSADFRRHAVGYLVIPALEGLAAAGWDLTCYANDAYADALTERFRAAAAWRPIWGLPDEAVAAAIRADGIDILFDLSGHSAGNRLPVFARRPAPVQVTWVGYPATTGLGAMDYILADRFQVPPGAERFYSEKVLRLPDSYVCFEPMADAPPVGPLPAAETGRVTFGSFNVLKKLTPQVIGLWNRLLARLPTADLVLKAPGLDDPATRRRFQDLFTGLDPDRLIFVGKTGPRDHLVWMSRVDIALDPFPYSGGQTTLETLWMGVPVITCPGETFCSRHSLGYLSTAGLGELVAPDFDEYVALASTLASDLPRLAALRATMRERLQDSALCDRDRFVANLSASLRNLNPLSAH